MTALGMAAAMSAPAAGKKLEPLSPGMKISMQVGETVTDEELTWVKQMGVEYLNVQTGPGKATLANFLAIKKRAEAAGVKVWNISNNDNRNIEEVTLGLPGRDGKCVVCCPRGFWRKGNVDLVCERLGIPQVDDLGALAAAVRRRCGG